MIAARVFDAVNDPFMGFIIEKTKRYRLPCIELNVNRNNSAIYAYEKLGWKAELGIEEMCKDSYNFIKKG